MAVATAAIEARQFDEARAVLEPLIPARMTQRVATLMARIEGRGARRQGPCARMAGAHRQRAA
ncbi:MAG: hypothetical protein WDN31_22540 [Hyphomicrobium sp.]